MVYKRGSVALALIAVGALAGVGRAATTVTLDTLLSGGSLADGNATYSNFTYGGVDANTVTVTASTSGNVSSLVFGRTSGTWTFDSDASDSDTSIPNYTATFVTPVTTLGLSFVGTGTASTVAGVTEDARDPVTKFDYTQPNLWVYTGMIGNVTSDSYTFLTPVTSLDIVKSIDIAANKGDVVTSITSVTNTYTAVPEPASLSLLGLGAMVLIRRRRRPVG